MRPLIGITADIFKESDPIMGPTYRLRENYCQAVVDAGGNPILIPLVSDVSELACLVDGYMIAGGMDLAAEFYGEPQDPRGEVQNPDRYLAERQLFQALDVEKPILGICYGMQFLNVVHGGSLVGHLPDRVGHSDHEGGTLAETSVEPGTRLAEIVGGTVAFGRSYHHQAVDRLGEGLIVSARHEDGTIEGIEASDRDRWLVGVQWHPERTLELKESRMLFGAFVEAARASRVQRRTP